MSEMWHVEIAEDYTHNIRDDVGLLVATVADKDDAKLIKVAPQMAAALVNVIAMAAKYYLPGTMDAAIDDCRAALDAAGLGNPY